MKLSEILSNIEYRGNTFDVEITDIVYDSRKANADTLFVCLVGAKVDGHDFASKAYNQGCRAFLVEYDVNIPSDAVVIYVNNTREALAYCSCNFFNHPSKKMKIIGITGTKGKTSIAHIVQRVLSDNGIKTGIIGTVGAGYDDIKLPTVNTTPESYEIQKLFNIMYEGGCQAVVIEVSSLGLKSHRVDGIEFSYGVFTNLFADHIGGDEHKTFEEYKECKKMLFSRCSKAIINADDLYTDEFIDSCTCPYITYGKKDKSDYQLISTSIAKLNNVLGVDFSYLHLENKISGFISMPGDINALNALVAISVAEELGLDINGVISSLSGVYAKGRSEVFDIGTDFSVIIDYAHNGISMNSILETVSKYEHNRLITVFGSVGDRAQLRRAELGEASGKYADLSIVTSDDPGFEEPQKIIDEITSAIDKVGGKWISFVDRAEAVRYAIYNAKKGDIIVFAGKGHEEFMKINGEKIHFSEKEEIMKALDNKRDNINV